MKPEPIAKDSTIAVHAHLQRNRSETTENLLAFSPEPFVDADTVASFLSIQRRQVLEMARAGKIPAYALLGSRRKVWRFKLSEVDDAASGTQQPIITPHEEGALARKIPESTMRGGSPRSQWRKSNGC